MLTRWWMLLLFLAAVGCQNSETPQTIADKASDAPAKTAGDEPPPGSSAGTADEASSKNTTNPSVDRGTNNGDQQTVPPTKPAEQPAATPDQLADAALGELEKDEIDEAIRLVEKALKTDPNSTAAVFVAARAYQAKGMRIATTGRRLDANPWLYKSVEAMRKLAELRPLIPQEDRLLAIYVYNEACCRAIEDDKQQALSILQQAIDLGFNDLRQLSVDEDFSKLREDAEFKQVVMNLEQKVVEQQREQVRAELANFASFPFEFNLSTIDGQQVSKDDYKGKILIVDIWGTWCPPCRQEIPHFIDLVKKYGDQGFAMVGVNYERVPEEEIPTQIQTFIDETGINYPCVIGDEETRLQIPDFRGYPTTLFLDGEGRVRLTRVGYHSYDQLATIVDTLLADAN